MEVKLGHLRQVAIAGTDIRRSIAFYRDVLGAPLVREFSPPGIAFFQLGATRLLIEQHRSVPASASVLYFEVSDVAAAQAALEAKGVRFDTQPHLVHRDEEGVFGAAGGEEWMTFFKDPDGNVLALAERRAPGR